MDMSNSNGMTKLEYEIANRPANWEAMTTDERTDWRARLMLTYTAAPVAPVRKVRQVTGRCTMCGGYCYGDCRD